MFYEILLRTPILSLVVQISGVCAVGHIQEKHEALQGGGAGYFLGDEISRALFFLSELNVYHSLPKSSITITAFLNQGPSKAHLP